MASPYLIEQVGLATLQAVRSGKPVVVMENGRHVATVFSSGAVDTECIKDRWIRTRKCLCEEKGESHHE